MVELAFDFSTARTEIVPVAQKLITDAMCHQEMLRNLPPGQVHWQTAWDGDVLCITSDATLDAHPPHPIGPFDALSEDRYSPILARAQGDDADAHRELSALLDTLEQRHEAHRTAVRPVVEAAFTEKLIV